MPSLKKSLQAANGTRRLAIHDRRLTIRINSSFQAVALACFAVQAAGDFIAWRFSARPPFPLLLSFGAIGITTRFLLARPRDEDSDLEVAYNWGFLLIILQSAVFQLTHQYSVEGFCLYFVVLCQLALIYRTAPAAFFMLLLALLYSITMMVGMDFPAILLIVLSATLGVSINFLIARLNRESLVSDSFFKQARWAASELSEVLLHLDSRIEDIRIAERQGVREAIAREIHDSVGCNLTALIVQLQVLSEVAGEGSVRERVENLETMSKVTLQEVRSEVSRLRNSEPAATAIGTYDRLHQLRSVFSECTGVMIGVRIEKETEAVLDTTAGDAVYRIVQEAFTNAYCHGCASMIDLSMKLKGDFLLIRISDNGNGCKVIVPGNGLKGMHERVTLLGGSVAFTTLPGKGFDIGIDIPLNAARATRAQEMDI
jgi:signal transduction histidine kinase